MFCVYVIKSSSTGKKYVGQTRDLEKRLYKHNTNSTKFTKNKGPWELIYCEKFKTRTEAIQRERFMKSGQGREFMKRLSREVA